MSSTTIDEQRNRLWRGLLISRVVNSESLSSSQANPHLVNDMLSANKFSLSIFTGSFLTKLNLKLY